MQKIIDVSKWQGDINWKKVAQDDVQLAILRASCYLAKDTKVDEYAAGCKANNIPFGVYHYTGLTNSVRAKQEADIFYNSAKNLNPSFWVLDLEDPTIVSYWNSGTTWQKQIKDAVEAFCTQLRARGAERIVLYTWEWWGKLLPDSRYNWAWRWYASYGKNTGEVCTTVNGCQLHQYTSRGKVDGINTNVDMSQLKDGATVADLIGTSKNTADTPTVEVPINDPAATTDDEKDSAVKANTGKLKLVRISEPKVWNVRAGNGTSYASLGFVSQGAEFPYVATADNGWYAFVYKTGTIGWIAPKAAKVVTK